MASMLSLGAGMDNEATGLQNIRKMGAMRLVPKRLIEERIDAIAEFSELGHFLQLPVKTYSSGMQARLMFAVATEFEADILVMDEWLSAGDAAFVDRATKRMEGFADRAKIIILGTHSIGLVQRVCNKVLALENGSAVYYGPADEWLSMMGH